MLEGASPLSDRSASSRKSEEVITDEPHAGKLARVGDRSTSFPIALGLCLDLLCAKSKGLVPMGIPLGLIPRLMMKGESAWRKVKIGGSREKFPSGVFRRSEGIQCPTTDSSRNCVIGAEPGMAVSGHPPSPEGISYEYEMLFTYKSDSAIRQLHSSAWHSSSNTIARIFPQRHGKGPSHRKDNNLSAEKGKGRSKQKERKTHHIDEDLALKPPWVRLSFRPLTIYPQSLSLRQRDSLFLEQARRYQDKILAEAEKEEEKEERTATITSLDELQLRPFVNEGIESQRKYG
ncbi:hypothetical protein L6452_36106 [Arctium lappa]|uniref:Uncharacterized protein n=1 Tax=Arctium lappa TaxID=4217 RepID=A0ACB8Y956_ARCLA|nr:hypothetical protein L6452_36106 [Arctium lappa]